MMDTPDEIMASAGGALQRQQAMRAEPLMLPRFQGAPTRSAARHLANIAIADGVILVATLVIGLIHPIGMIGFLFMLLALIATTIGLAVVKAPRERPVPVTRLQQADLRALPAQAERWLAQQRATLPAPAVQLADAIGARLETLSPQLARVADDTPEAGEVRTLVGEQLPAFLADYQRVPASLRAQAHNGLSPDAQLIEGLTVIEQEIAQLTQRLAAADLDQLSTRGRYLELKYRDAEG